MRRTSSESLSSSPVSRRKLSSVRLSRDVFCKRKQKGSIAFKRVSIGNLPEELFLNKSLNSYLNSEDGVFGLLCYSEESWIIFTSDSVDISVGGSGRLADGGEGSF